jgi:hypothetical protein
MRRVTIALALLLASCAPTTAPKQDSWDAFVRDDAAHQRAVDLWARSLATGNAPSAFYRMPVEPNSSGPSPKLMHMGGHVVADRLVLQAELAPDSPVGWYGGKAWRFWMRLDVDQNPRTPGHTDSQFDTTVCDMGGEFVIVPDSWRVYGVPRTFPVYHLAPYDCEDGAHAGYGVFDLDGNVARWSIPLAVLEDDGAVTVHLFTAVIGSDDIRRYDFDTRGLRGNGRSAE